MTFRELKGCSFMHDDDDDDDDEVFLNKFF